jgi:tRNA(adenine34) deaminase
LIREWMDSDVRFMRNALDLARRAEEQDEVPVGAVLVSNGKTIGAGWNRPIAADDPTSHAEIEALRQAASHVRNYRLPGSVLYVTLEPCVMCVGAILCARVGRLVFGTRDLRFGAVRSKFRLADSELLNHQVQVDEGLLAAESAELLTRFFRSRREVNFTTPPFSAGT